MTQRMINQSGSGWRPRDYQDPEQVRKERSDKGTTRGPNRPQITVNLPSKSPRRDQALLKQYAEDCGYPSIAALVWARCLEPARTWGARKLVALEEFRKSLRDPISGLPPILPPTSLPDPSRGDEQFDDETNKARVLENTKLSDNPNPVLENEKPTTSDDPILSLPFRPIHEKHELEPTFTYDAGRSDGREDVRNAAGEVVARTFLCDRKPQDDRCYINENSKTRDEDGDDRG
jgi:hypothetical protein